MAYHVFKFVNFVAVYRIEYTYFFFLTFKLFRPHWAATSSAFPIHIKFALLKWNEMKW